MTNTNDLRTRLLAAAFAVAVSAVFFATAIVPASPNRLILFHRRGIGRPHYRS